MSRPRRAPLADRAAEHDREQLAGIGSGLHASRMRRSLTQQEVADRAGVSRSTVGRIERGRSETITLGSIQRVAHALGRPLDLSLVRDAWEEPTDAGHLAMQELLLRLGRAAGMVPILELPTRPANPARSVDVALRDDRHRILLLLEAWNTFGDVGAAIRASDRKRAEADALAVARWGQLLHRVAVGWIVRSTARNRALLARYPLLFAVRFPGSSAALVRAITTGAEPPPDPALAWCDVSATRLFAWRGPGVADGVMALGVFRPVAPGVFRPVAPAHGASTRPAPGTRPAHGRPASAHPAPARPAPARPAPARPGAVRPMHHKEGPARRGGG